MFPIWKNRFVTVRDQKGKNYKLEKKSKKTKVFEDTNSKEEATTPPKEDRDSDEMFPNWKNPFVTVRAVRGKPVICGSILKTIGKR